MRPQSCTCTVQSHTSLSNWHWNGTFWWKNSTQSFPAGCKKTPTEQKKSGRLPSSTSSLWWCDTLHILETDTYNSNTVHFVLIFWDYSLSKKFKWETSLKYLKPLMWHSAHTGDIHTKLWHSSFSPHFLRLLETYTQNSNTVHLVLIFWDYWKHTHKTATQFI